MEENITYLGSGAADDKYGESSVGYTVSSHTSTTSFAYKLANGCCCTTPKGKVIVAVRNKALLHVYVAGKEAPIQKIPVPEQVAAIATCGSEWLLAGGTVSGRLLVWEMASGRLLFNKSVHYQKINKVAFTLNRNYLVACSEDSRITVFSVADLVSGSQENPLHTFSHHTLAVTDFQLTGGLNDDLKLVSVSLDSTCRIYNLTTCKPEWTLVLPSPAFSVALDPGFRAVYVGLESGEILDVKLHVVDETNKLVHIFEKYAAPGTKILTVPELVPRIAVHSKAVTRLAVSFDGTRLVSGDANGQLFVLDVITKQTVKPLKSVVGAVSYISMVPALNTEEKFVAIPPLQRALHTDSLHEIKVKIANPTFAKDNNHRLDYDLEQYLNEVAEQESHFKNLIDK